VPESTPKGLARTNIIRLTAADGRTRLRCKSHAFVVVRGGESEEDSVRIQPFAISRQNDALEAEFERLLRRAAETAKLPRPRLIKKIHTPKHDSVKPALDLRSNS
jgi:hypothetical protein